MSKEKKQLEKELKVAEEEYKKQFDYIISVNSNLEECDIYLIPYLEIIQNIKLKLQEVV